MAVVGRILVAKVELLRKVLETREGGKKYNTKEKKAYLWQLRTEILNNVNMTRTGGTRIKH